MAILLLGLILTVSFGLRVTDGQALRFVLNGVNYTNGSTVMRSDIGEGDDALQCTTDRVDCCRGSDGAATGEFYFPNGDQVPILPNAPSNSYYRNRGTGFIRLNRRSNAMETGWFRCEIPDASGTLVNLFINIANELTTTITQPPTTTQPGTISISISITASGTNTAGETYSLECSATVTGSTDQPTITWLDNGGDITSDATRMVSAITMNPGDGGYSSTLTFNPQAVSHAGTYTCRVTAGGVTETQTSAVIVNVITAQVTRSSSGPLTAGQTGFSLSCDVTGTENLNTATFTFQWLQNGGVIFGQQGSTLSLSPLTASNAGEYNCSVTVSSTSLSSTVSVNSSNTEIVSFQFPAPTSVTVTNGPVNVGSDVTLTCTVELSPAVDVLVTVNTEWTGPAGFMTTKTAQPVIGSTTTYTSTAMVSSFGRDQSGDYNCTATVSSTSSFLTNRMASSSTRVTVDVYLSLKGVIYPNNSFIFITEIEQTNTTSNNGLQCITDRRPCCAAMATRAGEWYFPDNGGTVPPIGSGATMATTFYRTRGDNGTVTLNRVNTDVMMPTGMFCSVIPDAIGVDQTLCANIVVELSTIKPPSRPTTTTGDNVPNILLPPLNVQATQSSASAPVEVSWSPPSGGAATITGYRIFYGNGENVSVSSVVSIVGLELNKDSFGQTVSVRSEADQLPSQLITATITAPTEERPTQDVVTKSSRSCALEIGVTLGVMLLLVCLVVMVITVLFVHILRKRRAGKNDLDQSTNMSTQLYEDPDKLTSSGQGNYELTECPAYESTSTRPQPRVRAHPTDLDQGSHYEL